jgi:hypothetical protein
METPTPPPTDPRSQILASLIDQAKAGGLKVRWHDATIVVIGIVAEAQKSEANAEVCQPEGGKKS